MSNLPVGITPYGRFIFSNIIFEGTLTINDCLLSVSQIKNVVLTPISGRNGTIKEYINRGDYEIRVTGSLVEPYVNRYPSTLVREFRRIMDLEREISVSSAFLNHFKITNAVVLNYNVGERLGVRNNVPFEAVMVSDEPIEIKVNA